MGWMGYKRANGSIGIRNKILVIYTVKCSEFVARRIVDKTGHPDVELVGFDGCTDNQYAVRLLISLIRHPNVGGILAVGLGCEYVQPQFLCEIAKKEEKVGNWLYIQEKGGTESAISYGMQAVSVMLEELKHNSKTEMDISDLVIGAECGGSDFTSGLVGNVMVGHLFDFLIDQGGTAVFEEIVEAVGLKNMLTTRGVDDTVKKQLAYTYEKAMEYCRSVGQYSISPGNFAGGLTTIEEKSMGALAKSGSRPIQGVLKVSEHPPKPGLWLLDSTPDPGGPQFGISNPNDSEGLMDLISCGAHMVFLVTGRGNVIGSAVSPCIKITGNHQTYEKMKGDMDFDAGRLLSGKISRKELLGQLIDLVKSVARGELTQSEKLGHKEFFIPYKYQEKHVCCKLF